MLVSIRLAKLLVNVFWIARMILAARLLVCLRLRLSIRIVLVRFFIWLKCFPINYFLFLGKMPTRMPMWQLQLWPSRKESDFDTLFKRFILPASSDSTKWLVFKHGYLNYFNLGGVTENFEFKINDDTEVFRSCSAKLNGEVFVFGGSSTSNNERKQVSLIKPTINFIFIYLLRSPKLLAANWNELAILITNSTEVRVVHTTIPKNESCFAFQLIIRASVKGEFLNQSWFLESLFSYDGINFHNHADSKNGHYFTTLANIDDAPLAVGGASSNIKKAEILDISSNTWTEVADYPYHE